MAGSPVDVRAMLARQMVERLAQGGPGGGAPGGEGGASPDAAGQQLSRQLSELQGADPQMMVKATEQLKSMALAIQVKTAFQVPEAASHMAAVQKSLDRALKALQQASATANTVSQPIVNRAGLSSPQPSPGGADVGPAMQQGGMPQ